MKNSKDLDLNIINKIMENSKAIKFNAPKSKIVIQDGIEIESLPDFLPIGNSKYSKDFKTPISHIITFKNGHSLYLGNQSGAGVHKREDQAQLSQDLKRLDALNIKAIVTCRDIRPKFSEKFDYLIIPMDKDHYREVEISMKMRESYEFIMKKLETGSVFVHCKHGKNRSATTVAYFLMRYFKADYYTVKEYMKTRRDCVKMKKFEDKLLLLQKSDC